MQSQFGNPCTRCGRERIVDKTWKEYLGKSLLRYTRNICPDKACQKMVDADIAAQNEKRELMAKKRSFVPLATWLKPTKVKPVSIKQAKSKKSRN